MQPVEVSIKRNIAFKFGDKFTKRPIQFGKYLVLLGRLHIHLFDVTTFQTKILISVGEDQAEKIGVILKQNPEYIKEIADKQH